MPTSDKEAVRRISTDQLVALADDLGLDLTPEERDDYTALVNGTLEIFDAMLESGDPGFPRDQTRGDRQPGTRPDPATDQLNAWVHRCNVSTSESGPLADLDIGLKDNIALASYPMQCGSDVFEGFVPTIDATVVQRVLDAGATITGKQNMESFAFSGSGDTSDFGPVHNPYDSAYLAGGSSGGSAAAVAAGDCDVSLGTDQAGSVRIPSACCGTVGLKPTTGLVPYTGVMGLDTGIDHVGPIARTVNDVARTLEVIAGRDTADGVPLDPRQPRDLEPRAYVEATEQDVDGMTIGILTDGFDWEFSARSIDSAVRDALDVFTGLGAETRAVSMDRHRVLSSAGGVIATMGGARTFLHGGVTPGSEGWHWSEFASVQHAFLDARTNQLPPSVKQALLTAAHVMDTRGVTPYTIAQNIAFEARRGYNRLLETCDVLALPTLAVPPMSHDPELGRVEATAREWTLAANTAATDMTGHPAISIPCGIVDGLPVGMMLVGRHFDETNVLRAAAAFEAEYDWK